ncbi:hypothetical protein [Streptomyces sp. NPDC088254]|uniref:hypothetical protein n=1 Tax=Streptomyces sp. NPDC088254 TaxID=3365847 RepID=UPI0037F48285
MANKGTETDNEPETYVRYSAFSREVRPIGEPITHAEDSAEMLAENGTLVRARPHYHVPTSRSFLSVVRSPFSFEAYVKSVICPGLVAVEFACKTASAPWSMTGAFKPSELHKVHLCECAACEGKSGIQEFEGA